MKKAKMRKLVKEMRDGILEYKWDAPPTDLEWEWLRLAVKHTCNRILGINPQTEPEEK